MAMRRMTADHDTGETDGGQGSRWVRLTGLWWSGSGDDAMLRGDIGPTVSLIIAPNPGHGDSQPAYIAYLAPRDRRQADSAADRQLTEEVGQVRRWRN